MMTNYLYLQYRYSCPRLPIIYLYNPVLSHYPKYSYSIGFTSELFPSYIPNKTALLSSAFQCMPATCSDDLLLLEFIIRIIFSETKLLLSTLYNLSSFCYLLSITSSESNSLTLSTHVPSLDAQVQSSRSCRKRCKIIFVFFPSIFTLFYNKPADKRF
jgi:hypothetical protein